MNRPPTQVRGIDAGDMVRLSVSDPDLNRDPQIVEAASVKVIANPELPRP